MKTKIIKNILKFSLLSLLIILSLCVVPIKTQVVRAAQQPNKNLVPNQILLEFNKGQSPDELEKAVAEKETRQKTFFGAIEVFWNGIINTIEHKATPEDQLKQISQADQEAGASSKSIVNTNNPSQGLIYRILLRQGSDVLQAVKIYKSLPEVKSAQPNYILRIMN